MSKKSFLIILVLSIPFTYLVAFLDDLRRNSLLMGKGGLPFRFSSAGTLSSGSTDLLMLLIDIVFWFAVFLIIYKVLLKLIKR